MKKYYLKESGEEIEFGDYIELEFSKKCGNASIYKKTGITFTPETVEGLLDMEIITVKETPNNEYAEKSNIDPSDEFQSIVKSDIIGATDKPCGVRTVANPKLLLNDT